MDAKWNKLTDHVATRVVLLAVGFGAWLAIGDQLLS